MRKAMVVALAVVLCVGWAANGSVLMDLQGNVVPVGAAFTAQSTTTFSFVSGGTPINQCVGSTLSATVVANGSEHGTPGAVITSLNFIGCVSPPQVNNLPYALEVEGNSQGGGLYSLRIDGVDVFMLDSELTGSLLDGLGNPPGTCDWTNHYCPDDFSTLDLSSCGVLSGTLSGDVRVNGSYQIDQPWILADNDVGLYYKDTVDNGDDPFTAGCHLEYNSNNCMAGTETGGGYGDRCYPNGMDLIEWTNQACHPARPLDSHTWYCDFECRTRYGMNGRCVAERVTCPTGLTVDSAKCECF